MCLLSLKVLELPELVLCQITFIGEAYNNDFGPESDVYLDDIVYGTGVCHTVTQVSTTTGRTHTSSNVAVVLGTFPTTVLTSGSVESGDLYRGTDWTTQSSASIAKESSIPEMTSTADSSDIGM